MIINEMGVLTRISSTVLPLITNKHTPTHIYMYAHAVVSTNNNNTSSDLHQIMAPVPSVCVRVPHSPSIDSGPCTPCTPKKKLEKLQINSDLTSLAVRECATPVCMQIFTKQKIQTKKKLFKFAKISKLTIQKYHKVCLKSFKTIQKLYHFRWCRIPLYFGH